MKITELFESEQVADNFDDMVKLIKRDCQPFLKEGKHYLVFRGMKNKAEYFKQSVRQDRLSKNMPKAAHNLIDEWFEEKFGFKARSTAVFAVGDFHTARAYGPVYAIFPIGDFKYVWSGAVNDLFADILPYIEDDDPKLLKNSIDKFMSNAAYKNKNLLDGIDSNNEIMIHCDKYYAFRLSSAAEANYLMHVLGQ